MRLSISSATARAAGTTPKGRFLKSPPLAAQEDASRRPGRTKSRRRGRGEGLRAGVRTRRGAPPRRPRLKGAATRVPGAPGKRGAAGPLKGEGAGWAGLGREWAVSWAKRSPLIAPDRKPGSGWWFPRPGFCARSLRPASHRGPARALGVSGPNAAVPGLPRTTQFRKTK